MTGDGLGLRGDTEQIVTTHRLTMFHIVIAISLILDDMAVVDDKGNHPIDPILVDIAIDEAVDPAKPATDFQLQQGLVLVRALAAEGKAASR